uniref:Odorant-binding protein 57d2 n=1 Tax=Drosophila ficusphila TaxID=30025 RepID=B0M2E3_DROFC|nr:odorant-binding protein 57d2 [Drosophila ficusphila]
MSKKLLVQITWLLILLGCRFAYSDPSEACRNHNGIKIEDANTVLDDWPANLNLAKVNRTHKCYVACIFYYFNIISYSGELTLDKYFDNGNINELQVAPTIRRCEYQFEDEKDFCEHTFGMFDCFRQEMLLDEDSNEDM